MSVGAIGSGGSSYYSQFQSVNKRGGDLETKAQKMFGEKDANEDGVLLVDELGISEDAFSKLDLNSDGNVDSDELQSKILEKMKSAKEMMAQLQNGYVPDLSLLNEEVYTNSEEDETDGEVKDFSNMLEKLNSGSLPNMSEMQAMMQMGNMGQGSFGSMGSRPQGGGAGGANDMNLMDYLFNDEDEMEVVAS